MREGRMMRVLRILEKIERILCILMFSMMVGATFLQVLNRNVLHLSLSWTEELARYTMIWMALLGTQAGLREGKQVSVEFLVKKFPSLVRRVIFFLGDLICCGFAGITAWYSIDLLKAQIQLHQVSPALKLPMVYVYGILTISFAVMTVIMLFEAATEIRGKEIHI